MKSFPKKAVQSAVVLLLVATIAGGLLSVFHDLLSVSAEERLSRTLTKVYGQKVDVSTVTEIHLTPEQTENAYGTVECVYRLADGNYLIRAAGRGGFKNGTVTLWTTLACTGSPENGTLALSGIGKVVYADSVHQTYIAKIGGMYEVFAQKNAEVAAGGLFSTDSGGIRNLTVGASFSSAAACNAVNCALTYFRTELIGETKSYEYEDYIDLNASAVVLDGGTVYYDLTTKSNSPARAFRISLSVTDGAIGSYEILEYGSQPESYNDKIPQSVKDGSIFIGMTAENISALLKNGGLTDAAGELKTGASRSTESCLRAAAFALFNYEKILGDGGLV